MKANKKHYSFDLVMPKGMKNDWIVVEASSEAIARKKLIKKLNSLNAKLLVVREFDNQKKMLLPIRGKLV